uniref:Uncharacterized protein n=1 Tax=Glossina pallidipes TaxID=7398 RepID=A0A1A9ZYL7_GLOPL
MARNHNSTKPQKDFSCGTTNHFQPAQDLSYQKSDFVRLIKRKEGLILWQFIDAIIIICSERDSTLTSILSVQCFGFDLKAIRASFSYSFVDSSSCTVNSSITDLKCATKHISQGKKLEQAQGDYLYSTVKNLIKYYYSATYAVDMGGQ